MLKLPVVQHASDYVCHPLLVQCKGFFQNNANWINEYVEYICHSCIMELGQLHRHPVVQ